MLVVEDFSPFPELRWSPLLLMETERSVRDALPEPLGLMSNLRFDLPLVSLGKRSVCFAVVGECKTGNSTGSLLLWALNSMLPVVPTGPQHIIKILSL